MLYTLEWRSTTQAIGKAPGRMSVNDSEWVLRKAVCPFLSSVYSGECQIHWSINWLVFLSSLLLVFTYWGGKKLTLISHCTESTNKLGTARQTHSHQEKESRAACLCAFPSCVSECIGELSAVMHGCVHVHVFMPLYCVSAQCYSAWLFLCMYSWWGHGE